MGSEPSEGAADGHVAVHEVKALPFHKGAELLINTPVFCGKGTGHEGKIHLLYSERIDPPGIPQLCFFVPRAPDSKAEALEELYIVDFKVREEFHLPGK